MSGERRPKRVAAAVRARLTDALRRELDDPRLSEIVITSVELPADLSTAHVRVRLLLSADDEARRGAALRSLRRVAGRLRRSLGPELGLRKVPELRFEYDAGPDAAARVDELLAEIRSEKEPSDE
jgi:ribosome-binding factor A